MIGNGSHFPVRVPRQITCIILDNISRDFYIANQAITRRKYIMKLSTKSRYGVRAMFDMAYLAGTLPALI